MFGLNVEKDAPHALFLSPESAEQAVMRLHHMGNRIKHSVVTPVTKRGQRVGYRVKLVGSEGSHIVTDVDVERFGL